MSLTQEVYSSWGYSKRKRKIERLICNDIRKRKGCSSAVARHLWRCKSRNTQQKLRKKKRKELGVSGD